MRPRYNHKPCRRYPAAVSCRAAALLLAFALWTAPSPARGEPRVVSLNPSLTAILLALDAGSCLVGVDDYSARVEPRVRDLPRVGGLFNPSLEAIVALEPDVVTLVPSAQQRDLRQRLEALGVEVMALHNIALEDLLTSIERLGARVDRAAAAGDRVAAIRSAFRDAEAEAAKLLEVRPTAVLVLQRDPLYLVGGGSFLDAMLRAAGAENLAGGISEPYPRLGVEWLIAAAPQLILDASDDPQPAARHWARWPSLPAVRNGRVVPLVAAETTLPGPYLDRGLRRLVAAVQGAGSPTGAHDSGATSPPPPESSSAP
jgi:iron complex transport system substrate-binding protein